MSKTYGRAKPISVFRQQLPSWTRCRRPCWLSSGVRCEFAIKIEPPDFCVRIVKTGICFLIRCYPYRATRWPRCFLCTSCRTAEDCEWGTGGEDPREIDRLKYGGATESVQHQRLKSMLATMLEADRAFNDIQVENVISRPPHWRKPDVTATFLGNLITFDLQLATTQLPDIVAREDFYEQHNIRYVWVTNSDDAQNLARQAFQDIYWNNNAQIFGLDGRAKSVSIESGELHLWALSVKPRFDARGLRSVWQRQLVPRKKLIGTHSLDGHGSPVRISMMLSAKLSKVALPIRESAWSMPHVIQKMHPSEGGTRLE